MKVVVSIYKDGDTQVFKKIDQEADGGFDIPRVVDSIEDLLFDAQQEIDKDPE